MPPCWPRTCCWQAGEPIAGRLVGRLEAARGQVARVAQSCAPGCPGGGTAVGCGGVQLLRRGRLTGKPSGPTVNEQRALRNEAEAVAARQGLETRTAELQQSRDDLETTLARSLLKPLGLQKWRTEQGVRPLVRHEVDGELAELAGQKSSGLVRRFVAEALLRPETWAAPAVCGRTGRACGRGPGRRPPRPRRAARACCSQQSGGPRMLPCSTWPS